jgi:hypothetical protein
MTRSKMPALLAAAAAAALTACGSATGPTFTPEQQRDLNVLFRVTSPYMAFSQAAAAGYSARLTDCMTDAAGAMGYHYGNVAFIDGAARLEEPEVLMYEPQGDGSLQLVGVEYVVPLSAADNPPSLFGLPFHRNEAFQLWVLHVWLYRENPRGLFADWNPSVSCAAAR